MPVLTRRTYSKEEYETVKKANREAKKRAQARQDPEAELRQLAQELMDQQEHLRKLYWSIAGALDETQDKLTDIVARVQVLSSTTAQTAPDFTEVEEE